MKRDLLRLSLVLGAVTVLLPLFAWIQHEVGYESFASGGVIICAALVIIGVLVTAVALRRERSKEKE